MIYSLHVYDGHKRGDNGRSSIQDIVWNLAKGIANRGHYVTTAKLQWDNLPTTGEHDGVSSQRIGLNTGSNEPRDQIPYETVSSLIGVLTLLVNPANFALQALQKLGGINVDVGHVHFAFAANVGQKITEQWMEAAADIDRISDTIRQVVGDTT